MLRTLLPKALSKSIFIIASCERTVVNAFEGFGKIAAGVLTVSVGAFFTGLGMLDVGCGYVGAAIARDSGRVINARLLWDLSRPE